MDTLEMAKDVQFNEKAEAQAVYDYTETLKKIEMLDIEPSDKRFLKETISEIISDELNHSVMLTNIYTLLTGIEPNKD